MSKRLLFTLVGIAAFAGLRAQCSVVEVPLVTRVNASSLIVEGKVTDQYSYWNSNHTMIYTANKIELYKIFKGSVSTNAIEIITEGGTVNMDKIKVEPTLNLEVGEIGLFTCEPLTRVKNNVTSRNALPQFEAYASLQGFVKYDMENGTAADPFRSYLDLQTEVYNVCAAPGHHQYEEIAPLPSFSTARLGDEVQAPFNISSFAPASLTAGTGTILTIDGSGFGSSQGSGVVRFKNADDGGATTVTPLASQYILWSTTQIQVEVPSNAGTGTIQVFNGSSTATSSGTLTITYAHLNVNFDPGSGTVAYQTDHINDNGSGGYTWRMNTGFDADANARASFMRAFDTWRCGTFVNWSIGATTSVNDAVSDGTNVICFDNTAPLSAGILGVCYSYWSACASGPTLVWYVNELDIIFDEGSNITPLTWEYGPATPSGSEYDFETVAVHELGHGHQLGHVIAPGAIMHYAISNGASNRSLGANDLAGGQFVQGKSVVNNICGPGAMSNTTCGSAPTAAFNANQTTVCTGASVSFTDQSTGSPTSWQWTFTGGSPNSSTLQSPSVTYSTPGVYDVTLVATNTNGSDQVTMTGYITVNATPTVNFTSTPGSLSVCSGDQITLSGTGAASYGWSGGISDGVPFSASSTTTYTVTGTAANGCTATATANVTVNTPTINIVSNPANGIVCTGGQATLTASGAQSYNWTGGITNAVAFNPSSTTTYTVTGTSAAGCTATAQRTITVQSCGQATVPCGYTITNKSQSLSATNVPAATQYRFKFYNNSTLALVQSITQTSRTFVFSSAPNLNYGTTYRWTVAVNTGSGFGAESSMNCTVILGVPTATLPCGVTYNRYNGYSAVVSVVGAVGYRYTFYDNVTNAVVAQVTQPSNYIYFSGISQLSVGATYKWTVEVEYNNGSGNVFGPASNMNCTVMMSPPTTTVPCNGTYNRNTGYTACPATSGATGYRFTFYQGATMVAQRAQTSNYIYFTNVSGLLNNASYTWTVEVQYNPGSGNVYGPASTPCNITFSNAVRLHAPDRYNAENTDFSFGVSLYPNPLGIGENPTVVIYGADQQDAVITVMDLTGRVMTSYVTHCEGEEFSAQLSDFPELVAGMYIMQVTVGDQVQSQRFIAE